MASPNASALADLALELLAACPDGNAAVSPLNAAMCVELGGDLSSGGVPDRWAGLARAEEAAALGGCRLDARAFLPAGLAVPGVPRTAVFSSPAEATALGAAWAEEASGGLIAGNRVRPAGGPLDVTLFSLAAFDGKWACPFKHEDTAPAEFRGTGPVLAMHATRELAHARGEGWAAVELPYLPEDGGLRFVALVREDGTPDVAALLGLLGGTLERGRVQLLLPRFSAGTPESRLDLMGTSLAREASGLSLDRAVAAEALPVALAGAWHDCRVDLDEEGTVATAVTEMLLLAACMMQEEPPVPIAFDRPFAFAIAAGDVPVFVGRVVRPEPVDPEAWRAGRREEQERRRAEAERRVAEMRARQADGAGGSGLDALLKGL